MQKIFTGSNPVRSTTLFVKLKTEDHDHSGSFRA